MPDLLIELFSEEIPARMQARAAADLKRLVTGGMVEAGLTYASVAAFATPRRLSLVVEGMLGASPALREERKGPRVDAPEQALAGFLRSTGLEKDDLEVREDKKGDVWFAVIEKPGRPAAEVVAEVVEAAIRGFPWPKSMRWGAGSLRWVRPLQSILAIVYDEAGAEMVPLEVDGLHAGDSTEGHRFMAPGRFAVASFEEYSAKLKRAFVMLDAGERAEHIWADATGLAFAQGLEVVEDRGLLTEVAGLVEWPVVLMGAIDEAYLGLPPEVLQTAMRVHQKFFSVKGKTGRIGHYITVANRETADQGAMILAGNGRVLAARLADAKFFWENDLRVVREIGLEGMAKPLENVTFHGQLGSQAERIVRIEALAREIAPLVGAKPDLAAEAARVMKADLASEMVYEFPELQGVMGRYYAQAAGHDDGVPEACEMHYKPLGPGDEVPREPVSVAVALADKIDTLTGFWAIDEKPTGSKDPFALRRAALGVIRLVLDNEIRVNLKSVFEGHFLQNFFALNEKPRSLSFLRRHDDEGEIWEDFWAYDSDYQSKNEYDEPPLLRIKNANTILESKLRLGEITWQIWTIFTNVTANPPEQERSNGQPAYPKRIPSLNQLCADLLSFFHDRLKVHLRAEGIRHDVIDACLALGGQDDLVLLVNRVKALQGFIDSDDGGNLLAGYKRANNILNAEEKKDGVAYEGTPEVKFAELDEERALFAALDAAEPEIEAALGAEDFAAAMAAMAALRGPIDGFFDKVTVNAESGIVRRNRLCLLNRVRAAMNRVAILSELEG